MDLFDILDDNNKTIVLTDRDNRCIYIWDGFVTLTCYDYRGGQFFVFAKKSIISTSESNRDAHFLNAQAQARTWRDSLDN